MRRQNQLKYRPGMDDVLKAGIYSIRSGDEELFYIGSTKNFSKRLAVHKCDCKRGKGNRMLMEFVYKYGWEMIEFSILEFVEDVELLRIREKYWIDHYGFDKLSNIAPNTNSNKGAKMPDSHKLKSAQRMVGNRNTVGYKHSPEKGKKCAKWWSENPDAKQVMIDKNKTSQIKVDRSSWEKGYIVEVYYKGVAIDECYGMKSVFEKYPMGRQTISKLLTGKKEEFGGYSLKYIGKFFSNGNIIKEEFTNVFNK